MRNKEVLLHRLFTIVAVISMEELMYYVWQQRMFQSIQAVDKTELEIIHPGLRNLDAGPDFFNAKIRIDGTVWAGNVEMHVKASDWYRHHHHEQKIYDSVILHVVMNADADVRLQNGEQLRMAVMTIPEKVMARYGKLTAHAPFNFSAINCRNEVISVPTVIMHDWQTALAVQRMLDKVKRVRDIIDDKQKSWPEALYVTLARALGTGVNSDACERIARSLPYSFLQKHLDNPLQIEALLLGQANLIDNPALEKEYAFLRAKFGVTPFPKEIWKMSRARPQASPQVRLRALTNILCHRPNLFSDIAGCRDVKELTRLLSVPKMLGKKTTDSLIINAIVPILLAFAQWQADETMSERALGILESLPAESNRFMDYWIACGIPLKNALESQAMLQLYKQYCEPHNCMRCRLGCWLIKQ